MDPDAAVDELSRARVAAALVPSASTAANVAVPTGDDLEASLAGFLSVVCLAHAEQAFRD